jgi:hypothetical protein
MKASSESGLWAIEISVTGFNTAELGLLVLTVESPFGEGGAVEVNAGI